MPAAGAGAEETALRVGGGFEVSTTPFLVAPGPGEVERRPARRVEPLEEAADEGRTPTVEEVRECEGAGLEVSTAPVARTRGAVVDVAVVVRDEAAGRKEAVEETEARAPGVGRAAPVVPIVDVRAVGPEVEEAREALTRDPAAGGAADEVVDGLRSGALVPVAVEGATFFSSALAPAMDEGFLGAVADGATGSETGAVRCE